MIRIGSHTDIGMNLNNSDCFGMNPNPKLSSEYIMKINGYAR